MVVEDDVDHDLLRHKIDLENRFGAETRYVAKDELHNLAPYLSDRIRGAVLAPNEGKIDVLRALPAIWSAVKGAGVTILTDHEVTAIELDVQMSFVHTQHRRVRCRRVVNAAGGWCPEVSQMMGWPLMLNVRPIQSVVTEVVPPLFEHLLLALDTKTDTQTDCGGQSCHGRWLARCPM